MDKQEYEDNLKEEKLCRDIIEKDFSKIPQKDIIDSMKRAQKRIKEQKSIGDKIMRGDIKDVTDNKLFSYLDEILKLIKIKEIIVKKYKNKEINIEEKTKITEEEWRIIILKKYNFKCGHCGNPANSVHHIYSRFYCKKKNPSLEWDLNNGIPLCYNCHEKITKDGRKWFDK